MPIFRLQKMAIRLIANIPRKATSMTYCKQKIILRLPDIYKQSTGIFIYKFKNGLSPNIFSDFFIINNEIHRYTTRGGNKLRISFTITNTASKFVKKTGVTFWNELEDNKTKNLKIGSFKSQVKSYIISTY